MTEANSPGETGTPPPARGVHIGGDVTGGAISTGDRGKAADQRTYGSAPPAPEHAELLRAIREVREQLPLLVRNEQTDELEEELADTEDEVTSGGPVARARLERLRGLLLEGGTAVSGLASAVALTEAIGNLPA